MNINPGCAAPYKQPPRRFAVSARYSSQFQNECSIEDQIADCREGIRKIGGVVVEDCIVTDSARSGKSMDGRDGLDSLLRLALGKNPPFDAIAFESTSRMGRNLTESLPITEDLKFRGIELYFVKDHLASWEPKFRPRFIELQKGDEEFSEKLAYGVKRGQSRRIGHGYIGSGRTFGYFNIAVEDPNVRGLHGRNKVVGVRLEINPAEAAVVERIFRLVSLGFSRLSIVHALNEEGVPSSLAKNGTSVRRWNVQTVTRMLNNPKYVGVYIYNAHEQRVNPRTRKKEMVLRPCEEWQVEPWDDLRIVPVDLWIAAHRQMELVSKRFTPRQRGGLGRIGHSEAYVFSGLMVCGVCGGTVSTVGGAPPYSAYGCSRAKSQNLCTNKLVISVRRLQSALLAHLADNLSSPDLQQVITAEFNNQLKVTYEERQKLQRLSTDTAESVERKRAELRRQIENAVQSLVMVGPSPALINLHQRLEQDLRALKPPSAEETDERQYTEEEVAEFLNQKLQDLRGVLAAEPELAKREMKHRIDKLILTPVETPEGRFYEISGDLRLLGAPESGVLDGSVHKLAQYSNFCLFPVSLRLPIDRRCGFKKAA